MIEEQINKIKKEYQSIEPPDLLKEYGLLDLWERADKKPILPVKRYSFLFATILLVSTGFLGVAQASKPDSLLYPVKTATDKVVSTVLDHIIIENYLPNPFPTTPPASENRNEKVRSVDEDDQKNKGTDNPEHLDTLKVDALLEKNKKPEQEVKGQSISNENNTKRSAKPVHPTPKLNEHKENQNTQNETQGSTNSNRQDGQNKGAQISEEKKASGNEKKN